MSKPQNSFEPYPNPKNSRFGPQKVKNDPKIKSKSKVRIEGTIEKKLLLFKYMSRPQNSFWTLPQTQK